MGLAPNRWATTLDMRKQVFRYTALVILSLLGTQGILSSSLQWRQVSTLGQGIQVTAQLLYGIVGIIASWRVLKKRTLPQTLEWTLIAVIMIAAGFATVVWAEGTVLQGLVSAVAGALLATAILWLARRGVAA